MKIIVGLGNPGNKYQHNRHNIGFMAIDHYLQKREAISCSSRFKGYVCEMHFTAQKIGTAPIKTFFVKPQTFMNNSGEAVKEIADYYNLDVTKDLLVIHDEVDLKFGYFKLAFDSRPAGHNGIKSIVDSLGTQEFHRVRIGIESRLSRHESPTDKFVLDNFTEEETKVLQEEVLPKIDIEIEAFILS